MITIRQLDALATASYDAALGTGNWETVLAGIARTFNGSHATLLRQELQAAYAHVLGSCGFDGSTVRSYEQYFKTRNVLLDSTNRALMQPGIVRTSQMMCPDDVLLKSEYYNDFLRPINVRYLLGTTAKLLGRDAVHLTVFRDAAAGPAEPHEVRALRYLAPHVQRALQVHERLEEASGFAAGLEALLDKLTHGTALVTGSGMARYMNRALGRMLASRDGLAPIAGGFAPQDKAAHKRFFHAVASAATGGDGGRFPIPRPSGGPAYLALVSPVGPAGGPGSGTVLVIVSDTATPSEFDQALLRETYGLTVAECAIACRLANGQDLEAIALAIGVTVGTLKTHLKRVFAKTETHRQADLVRLLLLGRAWA